jgi:hypothetical protein
MVERSHVRLVYEGFLDGEELRNVTKYLGQEGLHGSVTFISDAEVSEVPTLNSDYYVWYEIEEGVQVPTVTKGILRTIGHDASFSPGTITGLWNSLFGSYDDLHNFLVWLPDQPLPVPAGIRADRLGDLLENLALRNANLMSNPQGARQELLRAVHEKLLSPKEQPRN